MPDVPILRTDRLVLRPFHEEDAAAVDRLLSTPHISEQTMNFPYPYPAGAALAWIRHHQEWAKKGFHLQWAIALPDTLIGTVSLALRDEPRHGDIGYWIGVDHWNRGYATEAVRAVIAYGFNELQLPRIQATCFRGNIASARVLEKAGMTCERTMLAHVVKDGEPRDVDMYAISPEPTGKHDR